MLPTRVKRSVQDQATPGPVNAVRFNRDGNYYMTGGHDRAVKLWNTHTGKLVKSYAGHVWEVLGLSIAADNSRFASGGGDKAVFLWDVSTGKILTKLRGHYQRVNCVSFNADASVVFSGSYDATVRAWDCRVNSRVPIQVLDDAKDSISAMVVTDSQVVAASVDGCVRTYDLRRGCLTVDKLPCPATSVRQSGDGNCLLVSTLDSTVRLLDKESGDLLSHYNGHVNTAYRIESCLDRTDAYAISGSEDGRICYWDLMDSTVVCTLKQHQRPVQTLDFHPDQPLLLSGSSDGTVVLWDVEEAD